MRQIFLAITLSFLSFSSAYAVVGVHCEPSASHAWGLPPAHQESATIDFNMPSRHQCNSAAQVLATECYNGQCAQRSFRTNECCYSENSGTFRMGIACGEGGECSVLNLSQMTNGDWSGSYYYNLQTGRDDHQADVICHLSGF